MPNKIVWLITRRHAVLTRRILETYGKGCTVVIEGHEYSSEDEQRFLRDWCTNRIIRRTKNFQVIRDGVVIFGFHDRPDDFWAAESELPFVEALAAEKITRYQSPRPPTPREIASSRRSWIGCLTFVSVAAALLGIAAWWFLAH